MNRKSLRTLNVVGGRLDDQVGPKLAEPSDLRAIDVRTSRIGYAGTEELTAAIEEVQITT